MHDILKKHIDKCAYTNKQLYKKGNIGDMKISGEMTESLILMQKIKSGKLDKEILRYIAPHLHLKRDDKNTKQNNKFYDNLYSDEDSLISLEILSSNSISEYSSSDD